MSVCCYCNKARAIHMDHIVPKALRRRHAGFDGIEYQVPACGPCNWRKGTRRLVPESWAERIPELPSKGWRTWDGDPAALREVVK